VLHVCQLKNATSVENFRKDDVKLSKSLSSILWFYFHVKEKFSKV